MLPTKKQKIVTNLIGITKAIEEMGKVNRDQEEVVMGIGRRDFLRFTTAALAGATCDPLQARCGAPSSRRGGGGFAGPVDLIGNYRALNPNSHFEPLTCRER